MKYLGNWPWMGVILTYSTVLKEVEIKCGKGSFNARKTDLLKS